MRDMIADLKKTTEQKMHKSIEALKADLGKVRTGRAHTGILDHIIVGGKSYTSLKRDGLF